MSVLFVLSQTGSPLHRGVVISAFTKALPRTQRKVDPAGMVTEIIFATRPLKNSIGWPTSSLPGVNLFLSPIGIFTVSAELF